MEHDGVPRARASRQDGRYPRPQLVRPAWADLDGEWSFAHDDADEGREQGWSGRADLGRVIRVPFPPESSASGIGETGFHPVVWYARTITAADVAAAGHDAAHPRLVLHFGAVDFTAEVWIDGGSAGAHRGGSAPFAIDADALADGRDHLLVMRAEDDPHDIGQPRGKQDWRERAHSIWYDRTTGIWQPVWLEAVPRTAVDVVQWRPRTADAIVDVEIGLSSRPGPGTSCRVTVLHDDDEIGWVEFPVDRDRASASVPLPRQGNGQAWDELLWTPENPVLLDAVVELRQGGAVADRVESYLGLVSVRAEDGVFLLNDRPRFLRAVLEQGYWPESHLAAPSAQALHDEVALIKALGFDTVRLHQKVEDPRFLYWADRLGLIVWGEAAAAYEFSPTAVLRTVEEWTAAVQRDRSHPSVAVWVPLNESWGVQHIAHDPAQRAFSRALAELTRALDPTRPVVSNDGWEHTGSDILTVHDYEADPGVLAARYGPGADRAAIVQGMGPAGRRMLVGDAVDDGQPIMLTEFGGVRYDVRSGDQDGWGYSTAVSADDYRQRLEGLFAAVQPGGLLAGFCWTQLTDTMQEANGLVDEHRVPKLDPAVIRAIVTGADR